MPRTLRDAVVVTRVLGIQYLWIDALCIIQDNTSDWEKEAVIMGQVYRGAEVTIVAAAATNSNEGFLERPSDRLHARIPYVSSKDGSIKGLFQLWERVVPHMEHDVTVQASNWNTRAWTFQEQHLATRALYFGTHVTHFQCSGEAIAENSTASIGFWPVPWVQELGVQDPARTKPGLELEPVYNAWFDMVQGYSARSLTVSSDKLPAIASMAIGVLDALKTAGREEEYHAGLWEGDIVRGLLWKSMYDTLDSGTLSRPEGYRAPSWAWVSCDGPIYWQARFRKTSPECQMMAVETTVKNPTGQVSYGKITIMGKTHRIRKIRRYNEHDWRQRGGLGYSFAVLENGRCVADCDIDCGEEEVKNAQVHALLVASEGTPRAVGCLHALLLQPRVIGDAADARVRRKPPGPQYPDIGNAKSISAPSTQGCHCSHLIDYVAKHGIAGKSRKLLH